MSYRGHIENGVVVFDEPVELPDGVAVRVEVAAAEEPAREEAGPTLGEKLLKFAGTVPGLPSDLAKNHDHYLYGTPKE